jgi:uncharacterized protein (DUF305 family)
MTSLLLSSNAISESLKNEQAQNMTNKMQEVISRMHEQMMQMSSGNPDIDFLTLMIPHHQGAIDMANIILKNGKDKRVKKLAQEIIKAQKKEISGMQGWLKDLKK